MKNKLFLLILIPFLLSSCSIKKSETKNTNAVPDDPNAIILYYGESCPHCKTVEEYISQTKLEKKVKIIKKEVFRDEDNIIDLAIKAKKCNMPNIDNVGVPFIYYKDKCYMGDEETLNFLKSQTNL